MATAAKPEYPHITQDPEVCGGRPCVAGTRIRVMDIVALHEAGHSPEQILEEYKPPLASVYDVYAALVYWNDHRAEVQAAFEEDQRVGEQIERDRAAFLEKRSGR